MSIQNLKKSIDIKLIKFIFVGICNTIIGTTIMFLFYNVFHLGYWFSSASNYVIGSIFSYFLNKYFTFQQKEKSIKYVIRFTINIAVCYVIAYGISKPLCLSLFSGTSKNIQDNIALLSGSCFFTFLNYFGQRYFTFKSSEK